MVAYLMFGASGRYYLFNANHSSYVMHVPRFQACSQSEVSELQFYLMGYFQYPIYISMCAFISFNVVSSPFNVSVRQIFMSFIYFVICDIFVYSWPNQFLDCNSGRSSGFWTLHLFNELMIMLHMARLHDGGIFGVRFISRGYSQHFVLRILTIPYVAEFTNSEICVGCRWGSSVTFPICGMLVVITSFLLLSSLFRLQSVDFHTELRPCHTRPDYIIEEIYKH